LLKKKKKKKKKKKIKKKKKKKKLNELNEIKFMIGKNFNQIFFFEKNIIFPLR